MSVTVNGRFAAFLPILVEFRKLMESVGPWKTPDAKTALEFACTEIGEVLDASMRFAHGGEFARNREAGVTLADIQNEWADTYIMLATVLIPTYNRNPDYFDFRHCLPPSNPLVARVGGLIWNAYIYAHDPLLVHRALVNVVRAMEIIMPDSRLVESDLLDENALYRRLLTIWYKHGRAGWKATTEAETRSLPAVIGRIIKELNWLNVTGIRYPDPHDNLVDAAAMAFEAAV